MVSFQKRFEAPNLFIEKPFLSAIFTHRFLTIVANKQEKFVSTPTEKEISTRHQKRMKLELGEQRRMIREGEPGFVLRSLFAGGRLS